MKIEIVLNEYQARLVKLATTKRAVGGIPPTAAQLVVKAAVERLVRLVGDLDTTPKEAASYRDALTVKVCSR